MSRLPIKLKLTLAFAAVLAVVLGGTGLFLFLRFETELDRSIDDGLRSRVDELSALVGGSDTGLRETGSARLSESDESFAQILDERGRVVDGSGPFRAALTPGEATRAQRETLLLDQRRLAGSDDPFRLLAAPARGGGEQLIVVAGASVEERNEAVENLENLLLVGGPAALLLASLAGYGLAAASLRPVESMRRRAAAISADEEGQRLPVPPADDEIARLGHTLNAMLERLEKAFDRERTFVSDASHELRTPLAILKTELELALREGRSIEELEAALSSAAEETDRLVQLAEDLLVIARSDQGKLPVRPAPVDVAGAFAGVSDRYELRGREAGRRLTVEPAGSLRVLADPLRLRQALGNMVDNALRHGSGAVHLSALERDGRVELHVTDEGPGFPPGFLDTAFERFSRADESRSRGGAGLGLAIVEAIARAHGGSAKAANRPGAGADVWLDLPRG